MPLPTFALVYKQNAESSKIPYIVYHSKSNELSVYCGKLKVRSSAVALNTFPVCTATPFNIGFNENQEDEPSNQMN
jgi:hypothetical protein